MKAVRHQKSKLGISNQMIGLLPVFLFMFLTSHFSYVISFVTAAIFCVVSITLFFLLRDRFFQFMLFPSAAVLILYSLLLFSQLEPVLFIYSPLLVELFLVIVLSVTLLLKRPIMKRVRLSMTQTVRKSHLRLSISEFFYVAQIMQNLYTLHLFSVLVFTILPDSMKSIHFEYILMHDFGIVIGVAMMFYEQIRLKLLYGNLRKETWLPVLNDKGQVIGRIAQSISMRLSSGRFRHPVVRLAVLYDGKLFLTRRGDAEGVSPGMLDFPIRSYVPYKKTVEQTLTEKVHAIIKDEHLKPRFLVRYLFDDEKAKSQVSLYVLNLQSEDQLYEIKKRVSGKLWTIKQIEEELEADLFSKYFIREFPYLQTTIFFAEQYACRNVSIGS